MGAAARVLVLSSHGGEPDFPFTDYLAARGVSVSLDRIDIPRGKALRYLAAARLRPELARKIAEADPDIILFDDERDRAALMGLLRANARTRKPVIWFRGAVGGFNAFSPIDRHIFGNRHLARIVVRSYAMINHWAASATMRALVPAERIDCCHHCVEPDPAAPSEIAARRAEWGIEPDDLVIGSIGNARPIKNIEFAARAASAIRTDRRIRFLFIGRHDDAFRKRLEAIMPGAIVMPGTVDRADRYAGIFDIFVSPTRSPGEGFGLALTEAMGCGVPVVATHCGGAGDIVEHGRTGFLLPENLASWQRALQALAGDPQLRERMGSAGQARVCERFSVESTGASLLRILEDVLAETR